LRRCINTYIKPYTYENNYKSNLPDCIILDLDGTLAINPLVQKQHGAWEYQRSFYNPTDEDVRQDLLCKQVEDIITYYVNKDVKLFILSGREASCKNGTVEWLGRYICYHYLIMREIGDSRPDYSSQARKCMMSILKINTMF
jgi:hypothetical protein